MLGANSTPEEICAYFPSTYGFSVRPIEPPPEPGLQHAQVPAAGEALALDSVLARLPRRSIATLSERGALTHILFLRTAPRVAFAAYSRGVIRLFPPSLRLDLPDPVWGRLTLFEATVPHELGEAMHRLYLEPDPTRLGRVSSLCSPHMRSLIEDCYLWWLEEREPAGVPDDTEQHLLAAIVTTAVADPPRVRRGPMLELLRTIGVIED